jgi:hypothetical protein
LIYVAIEPTSTAHAVLEILQREKVMFVFAIETCGTTVAFTKETDRIMLDGILNGEREEGQQLRKTLQRHFPKRRRP